MWAGHSCGEDMGMATPVRTAGVLLMPARRATIFMKMEAISAAVEVVVDTGAVEIVGVF